MKLFPEVQQVGSPGHFEELKELPGHYSSEVKQFSIMRQPQVAQSAIVGVLGLDTQLRTTSGIGDNSADKDSCQSRDDGDPCGHVFLPPEERAKSRGGPDRGDACAQTAAATSAWPHAGAHR